LEVSASIVKTFDPPSDADALVFAWSSYPNQQTNKSPAATFNAELQVLGLEVWSLTAAA